MFWGEAPTEWDFVVLYLEKIQFIENGCLQNSIEYFMHRRRHIYLATENIHDVLINEVVYGVIALQTLVSHTYTLEHQIIWRHSSIAVSCDLCADRLYKISVADEEGPYCAIIHGENDSHFDFDSKKINLSISLFVCVSYRVWIQVWIVYASFTIRYRTNWKWEKRNNFYREIHIKLISFKVML